MAINLKTNLAFCFECDENTGTNLADANGGAFSGTLENGATWGAAKLGAAAVLYVGTNDQVVVPAGLGIDNVQQVSVACRFLKAATGTDYAVLFEHYNDANNRLSFQMGGAGVGASTNLNIGMARAGTIINAYNAAGGGNIVLSNGTWYHAVMVFDGSQTGNANRLKLYVNGALQTLTYSGTVEDSTTNMPLAQSWWSRRAPTSVLAFNGRIDQKCLWAGRALTAEEVTYLYDSGNGRALIAVPARGGRVIRDRSMGSSLHSERSQSWSPTARLNPCDSAMRSTASVGTLRGPAGDFLSD